MFGAEGTIPADLAPVPETKRMAANRRSARKAIMASTNDTAPRSFRQALKRAVSEKRLLVIPGAYDALSALLIERTGFDCMFVGGFPVAGARYGVPDIGLAGFADIAAAVRDIIAASDVPVLVDIDDGYGDVKNAVHTVQAYERMGASAVFLEDQAWPKRCGHMAGKKVVPAEIMEAKIKATMAERLDAETLICVRTDARAVLGFDEALRRAERYVKAGAEAIFVEAPESIAELECLAKSFDVPQFANPLVGGRTPILSIKEFEQLGFNAICFGLETIMHAAKAMKTVLEDMRAGTFALRDKGMSFEEFKSVVHYDRWDRIDNTYGVPEPARR
jgi:2-methylisocitrate lyase-like PEP mutase family enzyme